MGNFSGRLERVTTTDDDEVRGGLLRRQRSRRRQSILALGRNLTLASFLCHSGGTIMRIQWESAYSRVYGLQRKEMCILFLMTTDSPTQQLLYSPLAVITRFTQSPALLSTLLCVTGSGQRNGLRFQYCQKIE